MHVQQKMSDVFAAWSHSKIKSGTAIITVLLKDIPIGDSFAANDTIIKSILQRIFALFAEHYHHYLNSYYTLLHSGIGSRRKKPISKNKITILHTAID